MHRRGEIVRPTLHHFGLTTANLEAMLDWYGKVLGMTPNHQTSQPLGAKGPSGVRVAWVSNDEANHRIYEDPDRNSVELLADNFGDWKKSTEYLRSSSEFTANPMGAYVDPDAMIAARAVGASVEDVHRRGYAGELPPSKPMDPRVLL